MSEGGEQAKSRYRRFCMEYKNITDVKKPVSRIVFGTAAPAMVRGENVFKMLDEVFAAGINTFDTARSYGLAEKSLGAWIAARDNRDELVLLAKGAHPLAGSQEARVTPEAIREDVEKSLEMLGTSYLDIYMLHKDCPKTPVGPLVETLNELREEGKIGVFGGSDWSYERIDEANEFAYAHDMFGFDVSSSAYSLAEQKEDPWGGCVDISGPKHSVERSWYQDKGVEVFAYASLGHGFLSGKFRANEEKCAARLLDAYAVKGYFSPVNFERLARAESLAGRKHATVPQIALAWLLQQPLNPMAICSASAAKKMLSNVKALDLDLSAEELEWLSNGDH